MELSRSSSVEAVGEMVAALTDQDETVRWLASASLAQLGGPTVILALRSFLVSDLAVEPGPRLETVKLLGRVGDGDVRPMVGRMRLGLMAHLAVVRACSTSNPRGAEGAPLLRGNWV